MEPPRGFWSSIWRLFYFLPFFLGLLLLGIIKGVLLCPFVCPIMTTGNSAIILGLWPAHAFWTFYCIVRAKQLGPVLKLALSIAVSILLVLWPLIGIVGSALTGAGYGFLMPVMATFDAVGEGKQDKFKHCILDGSWSTIRGSCTVVRDLKDVCFHSYFSIMDDLRLQDAPNGKPYEIRLSCIPGAFLAGVLGIFIDLPIITLIALFKGPYMLFKGWNRLFHDLMGREGPFLETVCVPFAGLAILLWPAAVAGAVLASILSSLFLGGYAAVVAYQESSIKMGVAYIASSLSMFDEYSNDVLDLPEGSCFPRYQYRTNQQPSRSSTFSRPPSFNQRKQDSTNPSRTASFKNTVTEMKPLKLLEQLFAECKLYGENLIAKEVIIPKDINEFKSGKDGSSVISIGLPAYCILRALVRSARENVDGLLFSDNTEIMTLNRPKDTFFDFFFEPLMIIKEQIRVQNFTEEEENYLCELVLLLGHPERLSRVVATPPSSEQRRAEINAIARRLRGITKSISRYPTVRRRFDELLKLFSEELERKMGGSEPINRLKSSRSFLKAFSMKSLEIRASMQEMDQGAHLTNNSIDIA